MSIINSRKLGELTILKDKLMKKGLTELVCILDRSGSMSSIMGEAIGGFNSFLKEQKEVEGDANITVALFDDKYELLHDNVSLNDVEDITSSVYYPRAMTALYDAIGNTVNTVGERLANTPEDDRPETVIVAILTDGNDNRSRVFTTQMIKEIIEHQESKYDWTFMYLAANQDAFAVGQQFGMSDYNTINFNANAGGARGAFQNIALASTAYRKCSKSMSKSDVMYSANLVDENGN